MNDFFMRIQEVGLLRLIQTFLDLLDLKIIRSDHQESQPVQTFFFKVLILFLFFGDRTTPAVQTVVCRLRPH